MVEYRRMRLQKREGGQRWEEAKGEGTELGDKVFWEDQGFSGVESCWAVSQDEI